MTPRCAVALAFTAAAGCTPLSQLYGGTSGPYADATVDSDAPGDAKSFDADTTDSTTAREDAGSDAADGGASATDRDSGGDGGWVNDGAAADAGGEAGVDAGTTGFCVQYGAAANALFCDDFDQAGRTDIAMEGWAPAANAGLGQIESSVVASPPNAAGLAIPDGDAGRLGMQKTLPFASGNATFRVAAKLQPVVGDADAEVMRLQVAGACTFMLFRGGSTVFYCPNFAAGPPATGLVEGQWNDVALSLQRPDAGAINFSVTVGSGPLAVTNSETPSFDAGLGPLNVLVQFGQGSNDLVGGIYVDNVLVTSE